MEASSSNLQELEKGKEIDHKLDPDLSKTEEDAPMKPEESKEKTKNATCLLALDTIIKSLRKIRVFMSDLKISICQETHQIFTGLLLSKHQDNFLSKLSLTCPLEENGVSDILVTILDNLPQWNHDFVSYEMVKMNCIRCNMVTEYTPLPYYGVNIVANSLRKTKFEFEHFSFENILKVITINAEMGCNKEGCGKRSYVQRLLKKLPSVFTMSLVWENNETEEKINETVSVLATDIDISEIYKYDGDSPHTKYCVNDQYSCVALENDTWVRYFGDEQEVIGDWGSVLRAFMELNMRPEIVFFENNMKREEIENKQRDNKIALEKKLSHRNDWLTGGSEERLDHEQEAIYNGVLERNG